MTVDSSEKLGEEKEDGGVTMNASNASSSSASSAPPFLPQATEANDTSPKRKSDYPTVGESPAETAHTSHAQNTVEASTGLSDASFSSSSPSSSDVPRDTPPPSPPPPSPPPPPSHSQNDHDTSENDRSTRGNTNNPLRLGLQQIYAMLVKNLLTKYRTPIATFVELFSPVLMMLILVAAYTLSEIENVDERSYSNIELDVPGPWLDLLERGVEFVDLNTAAGGDGRRRRMGSTSFTSGGGGGGESKGKNSLLDLMQQNIHDLGLDTSVPFFPNFVTNKEEVAFLKEEKDMMYGTHSRELQMGENGENGQNENNNNNGFGAGAFGGDVFDLFNDARSQLNSILEGPLPIPTFSQYVTISSALSSLIDPSDFNEIITDSSYGREWGNLLTLGTLHITPSGNLANEFISYLNETYGQTVFDDLVIRVHDTEEDGIDYINDHLDERTWALLDLHTGDMSRLDRDYGSGGLLQNPNDFLYKIRMNYTTLPNTNELVNYVSIGLDRVYQRYYLSGYLTLQRTLNEFAFHRLQTNSTTVDVTNEDGVCSAVADGTYTVWSMPMPTAAYSQNAFFTAVGYLLGLTIAMAYMYPTSRLIKSIVEEKETRMKETMLILGVRSWAHWTSWIITSLIVFVFIDILVTLTLSANVLKYSSATYLFIFILLFSTATIGFCFFVAAFFSRAKLAAIIGPVALFATLLPRWIFFGTNRYEATTGKMWASLLPCTTFAFGADIIADYEYAQQGIQSYNASEGEYSFNTALGFLFLDTFLYLALGWYIDMVMPRQYGVAKKWYFLLTPEFWFGSCGFTGCRRKRMNDYASGMNMGHDNEGDYPDFGGSDGVVSRSYSRNVEAVSDQTLIPQVHIRKLVKRYNKKAEIRPAVDNLNLTMYESQITCLLGHNGAGKSTTISVLTGLFPATSGDCIIYGKSISHNLSEARQSMGICPQHNVLFERLTILEHLKFFERIKGIRPDKSRVMERAQEIGLGEYVGTTSAALSGGNKRKLSVAIALCGDPLFLLLDEPTSGMDPYSRRATWELLRRKKQGRVTLLTTHFMDEAELLADRIAVMKDGRLQCCGSGIFLKRKFGLGYNLTVMLSRDARAMSHQVSGSGDVSATVEFADQLLNDSGDELERGDSRKIIEHDNVPYPGGCASVSITNFLRRFIPGAELIRKSARELTYRFPQGTEDLYASMFDALETEKDRLCIGAYGISNTTLEEVFLQLAEIEESNENLETSGGCEGGQTDVVKDTQSVVEAETAIPLSSDLHIQGKESLDHKEEENSLVTGASSVSGSDYLHSTEVGSNKGSDLNDSPNKSGRAFLQNPSKSGEEMIYMTPFSQIALLFYKRFLIQKRDLKGAFFMIILPVLVIGLVLLILMLDVVLAGPEIEMSIDLYDTSPSGSNARTDVVVGGGAALSELPNRSSASVISNEVESMKASLQADYAHADFVHIMNASSSDQVSQYLMETYNDHSHDARYGSIVFEDEIRLKIETDWENIESFIDSLGSNVVSNNIPTTDIGQLLGLYEEDGVLSATLYVTDIADAFFNTTSLTYDNGLNLTLFKEITGSAVDTMLASPDGNRTRQVELVGSIRSETEVFADQWFRALNSTAVNVTQLSDIAVDLLTSIVETLTGDTYSNFSTAMGALFKIDDDFSRDAVEEGLVTLTEGVLDAANTSDKFNSTLIVDGLLSFLDTVCNATNVSETMPNDILAAVMVAADAVTEWTIENVIEDGFLSLRDVFGTLSILAGGSFEELDGYWKMEMSPIMFDSTTQSFVFGKVTLDNKEQNIFSSEAFTVALDDVVDVIKSMLPLGRSTYNITFDSAASILHNSSSPHAVAAFNQAYMLHLYRKCSSKTEARLVSVNHPLPLTTQQSIEIRTILSIFASLFILIPYCYIPAAFVVFLVKERVSKSKHLQLVSGVNMSSYWIATYLWDVCLYLILTVLIMVIFLLYGTESAEVFVGSTESFFCTAMLTFGYGLSALPFAYLMSRMFDNHSTAQISVMGIFFITGFVAVNAYFIMSSIENTKDIAESLRPLFRMWPAYNVGDGFIQLSSSFWLREVLGEDADPFDWDVCGKPLALLYGLSVPYFVLLLMLEYSGDGGSGGRFGRILRWLRGSYENCMLKWNGVRKGPDGSLLLDDDLDDPVGEENTPSALVDDAEVEKEREYVARHREELKSSASVLIADLWKVYPPSTGVLGSLVWPVRKLFHACCRLCHCCKSAPHEADHDTSALPKRAVRGLTTAITEGETYGLLGVNGAGKTTCLGILTGDITPTSGEAYVSGFDVTGNTPGGVSEARKHIGFCPQVDPLLDLMTGRETLKLFGRLRGIPKQQLDDAVNGLLDALTLTPHADKVSESYSGGNKRKLSLGVALIGNPKVLFIDEASSGMDPAVRRKTWDLIAEVSKDRSVVLTTHVMEEAEALCTRVGIMFSGKLRCLGSIQHLKTTFLDGYTIDLNCETGAPEEIVDSVKRQIFESLPGSQLAERHGRYLRFDVLGTASNVGSAPGLGDIFRRLQTLKQDPDNLIEDYSISQCSLEQVFISIARSRSDRSGQGE